MLTGFEIVAAKPKGLRAAADAPSQESMRGDRRITLAPSTDQKKVRRAQQRRTADVHPQRPCPKCHVPCQWAGEHGGVATYDCPKDGPFEVANHIKPVKATVRPTHADKLQPGDRIMTPHGQAVQVSQVRNHETSGAHVYLDTESGTTLVPRNENFTVVEGNTRQELPGFGVPGGNLGHMPGEQASTPYGGGGYLQTPNQHCPICGTTMDGKGGLFVCPRDGFNVAAPGAGGHNYTTDVDRSVNAPRSASMSSPAGECAFCEGTLVTTASREARCTNCATPHVASGDAYVLKLDPSAYGLQSTSSAISRRAQTVLATPEGAL